MKRDLPVSNGGAAGRCILTLALAQVGCASVPLHSRSKSTTEPGDVACPRYAMVEHVWDDRSKHGTVHHDVWVMECPCCGAGATAGNAAAPQHASAGCPKGAERCPMCRATTAP